MNTGLGLSFWRIVNEEGSNGWAQIYARIPFDDVELKNKGALFGVVFGEDKENWAEKDSELMSWVEEYFNKLDSLGDLSDFASRFREKYPDLMGVWVWINSMGNRRELRIAKWGESGVILTRNNKEFDISSNLLPGKIIKGIIEDGDKLSILTGKFKNEIVEALPKLEEKDITKWNKELMEGGDAAAGLIFNFEKMIEDELELIERVQENKEPKEEVHQETAWAEPEQKPVLDLAQDRFIGPIGFKEKVANWISKVRPIKQRDLAGHRETTKRKKWAMILGVTFLVLLVLSLVTGSIKMKKQAEQKKWQGFAEPIEKSLAEAGSLVTINPTGARKLIEEVRVQFDTSKGQYAEGKYKDEVANLEKKINDAWTVVSGEKDSEIEERLRIDLVRQGFKGDRLGLVKDGQYLALDSLMGVVVTADEKTKDIKVAAGRGEGLGWVDVAGDGSKPLVLSGGGIRNAITGVDLIKFDAAVASPVALGKFGSNLYVLDKGNKEIYKYAASGDGYGDRTRWLKQDEAVGFDPVDMAIDVDIWVVSEKGQVEKFRRGARENFSISGLPDSVRVKRLAVEQEGTRLALLDAITGSVMICDKETGSCGQTLKSSKLIGSSDIEFSPSGELLVLYAGIVGVLK